RAAADAAYAAADAAADAAYAAARAARAAASYAAADLAAMRQGNSVADVPLWRSTNPEGPFAQEWDRLKAQLVALPDANWWVWTEWYEARLRGDPPDIPLEERRALDLTEDDWDKGPVHANALIAKMIEDRRAELAGKKGRPTQAKRIEELLGAPDLRAALSDFEPDELGRLMLEVPFAEDLSLLGDESRGGVSEVVFSELLDLMRDARRALDPGRTNTPVWLADALNAYITEASLGLAKLRPGRLWDVARTLLDALEDADIEASLNANVLGILERAGDKHLAFMKSCYALTLERLRGVELLHLNQNATPEQVIALIEQQLAQLDALPVDTRLRPDPVYIARTRATLEELRSLQRRLENTNDPARKKRLEESFWTKAKGWAVTFVRLKWRTLQGAGFTVTVGSAAKDLWPETMKEVVERIAEIFGQFSGLGQ
ncbi:MAG: hypothetical protein AAF577_10435, partial [Pseudomonadota bacterium]